MRKEKGKGGITATLMTHGPKSQPKVMHVILIVHHSVYGYITYMYNMIDY